MVLRAAPYGEADLLVTFLTLDFGVVTAFAKSPRKIKSRFGSSLEPFTLSTISLWGKEDARLPKLTQSDIIRPFQGLREDLGCFLRLSEAAELTINFLPEGEPSREAFHLLRRTLEMSEAGCSALCAIVYKIKLLGLAGFAPRLSGCARCGREGGSFFVSQGSILCPGCAHGMHAHENRNGTVVADRGAMAMSAGAVRLYRTLSQWDIAKTARVRASEGMLAQLSALLDAHIEYRLSKRLRTREAYASFKVGLGRS
ncbi:MAG: DNA repair protein RecO [Thermodesulfovibrionales bacterium]